MGRTSIKDTTPLLPHALPDKPIKFPLGLVSEGVRPYLELIRLEKASQFLTVTMSTELIRFSCI